MKKIGELVGVGFLLAFSYWLTTLYPVNGDMWFHLASGRIIAAKGIIHYDLLSQAGPQRSLIPYEWFFQSVLYWLVSSFGLFTYKIFIGVFAVINVGVFYLILRKIFQVKFFFSLAVSVFYFLLVSSFFVGRPQLIAYTCLVVEIYILFLYILKSKNYLWLLFPLTYLWSTTHPSIVVGIGYIFAYVASTCFMFIKTKQNEWMQKTKLLFLIFIGMCLASILPPQGFMGYQYILTIEQHAQLFSQNIIEWVPLTRLFADLLFYSSFTLPIVAIFFYVIYKKKTYEVLLWMIPIIFFILYGFTALRNIYFGYLGISILAGWLVSQMSLRRKSFLILLLITTGVVVVYSVLFWAIFNRISGTKGSDPENAARFLQKYHLEGNMFNQYDYGGYLEYQLYPKYKVFIDGRTDLFLCCELPEYFSFQRYVLQSKNSEIVNHYFEKHEISFVVLEVKYDDFGSHLYQILQNDPQWSLVYWDDGHVIFVKNDGKNTMLIKKFGAAVVTPFDTSPYKNGQTEQAYKEYSRMIRIADSAISRNALGYIYFISGDMSQAKEEFTKAIQLDSTYESGYSNLAEVVAREKDYAQAIALYTKAISLNPNRPILYIRLGQLYQIQNDIPDAENTWQQGLDHTSSDQYRKILQQLLQSTKQ